MEFAKNDDLFLARKHTLHIIKNNDKRDKTSVETSGLITQFVLSQSGDSVFVIYKSTLLHKHDVIELIDVRSEQILKTYITHDDKLTCVNLNHDFTKIVAGSGNGKLFVYDVSTGKQEYFKEWNGALVDLKFSPDGSALAAVLDNSRIIFMDMNDSLSVLAQKKYMGELTDIEFINNDELLVVGERKSLLRISMLDREVQLYKMRINKAYDLEIDTVNQLAYIGTSHKTIVTFDLSEQKIIDKKVYAFGSSFTSLDLNSTATKLAAVQFSSGYGKVYALRVKNKSVRKIEEVETKSEDSLLPEQPIVEVIKDTLAPKLFLVSQSNKVDTVTTEMFQLKGYLEDQSTIKVFLINDERIALDSLNRFNRKYVLKEGINKFFFESYDVHGNMCFEKFSLFKTQITNAGTVDVKDSLNFISIIQPSLDEWNTFAQYDRELVIKGKVNSSNGVRKVLVNDVPVEVINSKYGYFESKINIPYLSSEVRVSFENYDNETFAKSFKVNRPIKQHNDTLNLSRNGKDYALLFATNEFDEFTDLNNPVYDAQSIKKELEVRYGFEVKIIENPSLDSIYKTLRVYSEKLYNDGDQLFVFFAGHGVYDPVFKEGYIVCKDSRKEDISKSSLVSHSNLRNIVNNIPCNHIFLTLDVCFGGTFDPIIAQRGADEIKKSEFINRKLKYKSRLYLTSGGKEYVPDGRPGAHSPFANKLLSALRNSGGEDKILTMNEVLLEVQSLSPEPRQGEFGNNEPGGDFLFICKE